MCNWCQNSLYVSAKNNKGSKKELEKFVKLAMRKGKGEKTDLSLNNIVPIPKSQKSNWYDWNSKYWGTKWDIEAILDDLDEYKAIYHFDSAWAPPVKWLEGASKKFLSLTFLLKYEEEGMKFLGVAKAHKGKLVQDETISY